MTDEDGKKRYGYMIDDRFIIPCLYDDLKWLDDYALIGNRASDFEGITAVELDGRWGIVDKYGRRFLSFLPNRYDAIGYWDKDDKLATVRSNGKWGYVDERGELVIPCAFDNAHPFYEGLAAVESNGKWGYIDKTGALIIPYRFDRAQYFKEGLGSIAIDGKWGYVDRSGKVVIPCKFETVYGFSEGAARVKSKGQKDYVYIDRLGRVYPTEDEARKGSADRLAAPDMNRPPILDIVAGSIRFVDSTGDKAIGTDETCKIIFRVHNAGEGPGMGCVARIRTSAAGIEVADRKLPTIAPGQTVEVELPV